MSVSPADDTGHLTGHLKLMAGIGGVCVQWALLEHLVLGMIATNEGIPLERAYIMFGSLDMKPRLDMAINLARHAKTPVPLVSRIVAVRSALKDERLSDRRNQAVHGVHKATENPDSIELTMPRLSGPRRTQIVSAAELCQLASRIAELSNEIWAIGDEVHAWKMRVLNNRLEDLKGQFGITDTAVLKIAKDLYASAKGFWRNFKL